MIIHYANFHQNYLFKRLLFLLSLSFFCISCSHRNIIETGHIERHGEENPHGIRLNIGNNVPSIVSDYNSRFSTFGSIRSRGRHTGLDFKAPIGQPVIAASDGRVIRALYLSCGGNTVYITHGRDQKDNYIGTGYTHLDKIFVQKGQLIKRGERIGTVGITGSCASGNVPHLHFLVFKAKKKYHLGCAYISKNPNKDLPCKGKRMNPHKFWYDGEGIMSCFGKHKIYESKMRTKFTIPVECSKKMHKVINTKLNRN